jgi:hypothetical protein
LDHRKPPLSCETATQSVLVDGSSRRDLSVKAVRQSSLCTMQGRILRPASWS